MKNIIIFVASSLLMRADPNGHTSPKYDSFSSIFFRYGKGLVSFAREFGLNRQEAEDIVHDVFVNLWERMDQIETETAKSYLFRSIRNGCVNYITRLKNRTVLQEEILETGELPSAFDEDVYIYSELKKRLGEAIDRLPPQQKKIYVMARQDRRSTAEIAQELSLSPRTVEKHLELASRTIRGSMAKYVSLMILLHFI